MAFQNSCMSYFLVHLLWCPLYRFWWTLTERTINFLSAEDSHPSPMSWRTVTDTCQAISQHQHSGCTGLEKIDPADWWADGWVLAAELRSREPRGKDVGLKREVINCWEVKLKMSTVFVRHVRGHMEVTRTRWVALWTSLVAQTPSSHVNTLSETKASVLIIPEMHKTCWCDRP